MNTKNNLPTQYEMEHAFIGKDASYDGIFFTGVRTTGIFCRPSCTARKPLPENLEYFATVKEALFAGYRACLRCRPLEISLSHPDWARDLISRMEQNPSSRIKDSDLRSYGIDPARARRYFLKNFNMTFQAFCRAQRMGKALEEIRKGKNLDDIGLDHGYESYSGFREAFAETFGEAPGRSRNTDCIVVSWVESPLGPLVAGSVEDGICLLEFTDRRMLEKQFTTIRKRFSRTVVPGNNELLERLKAELTDYFDGQRKQFTVPLVYPGSDFQKRVWQNLLKIPYGETRSYQDLAVSVGSPGAVRAVGTANGMNRIAIVIPCHRVVNKDGQLGGYGGGLWRKKYLLDLEQNRLQ